MPPLPPVLSKQLLPLCARSTGHGDLCCCERGSFPCIFPGGVRQFAPSVHDPKTGTSRGGHVPGYQGHVPLGSKSTNTVASRSLDKSLVLENYRHNLVGYTGNRR